MIRFDGATFDYDPSRPALRETSLDVGAGLTLVLGPNGAGKSTLLKLGAGVERPGRGRVLVDGLDLWTEEVASRRLLAYVPEYPDLTPYATVGEVIRLVCRLRGLPTGNGAEALARAGLEGLGDRTIRELSMGQRRRAMLAAAFIGHPPNILLDEPLEGMDRTMRESIVNWVGDQVMAASTVLVATHELEPFAERATRALGVAGGRVTMLDPLPVAATDRLAALQQLARGNR